MHPPSFFQNFCVFTVLTLPLPHLQISGAAFAHGVLANIKIKEDRHGQIFEK